MDSKNVRKACDLCYRKRIKCDSQRPRCSNCQIYLSECTRQAVCRKKKKKTKKPPALTNCHKQEQQRQRQEQQEREPKQVYRPDTHHLQQHLGSIPLPQQSIEKATEASLWAENPFLALPPPVSNQRDSVLFSRRSSTGRNQRLMELPSEGIVRHVVDAYLTTFNSLLPLFHPQSLYLTVDDWYRQPSVRRKPSAWATINVVFALAQCHDPGNLSSDVIQAMTVAECLENAQSVLSDVLAEDLDLQSVQILLGLGILFLGAKPDDIRAPMTFVATAIRLAQAIGMHRRDFYEGIAPPEAIQRRRVFWIAYILDKDVAARMRQAPIQHDTDMDLDLPPDEATVAASMGLDDAGFISVNGCRGQEDIDGAITRFNMFRARVELAQIQSRVYDCAFSVRASRTEPGELARLAQSVRLSIQHWKSRLPAALSLETLSSKTESSSASCNLAAMCYMQSLIIMCLGQLCQVNSMDFHWIEKVLSYARGIGDGMTTLSSSSSFASSVPPPPQPQGWNVLVSECRDFMRLFQSIGSKQPAFINVQLCPFASGLLCLSVNAFLNFEDSNRLTDQHLMARAVSTLGRIKEQTQSRAVSKVLEVCAELDWHLTLLTTGLMT